MDAVRGRITERDRERIVPFIARANLVTAVQVSRREEMSLSRVYRRLAALRGYGLLWHDRFLADGPGVYGVTGDGARTAGTGLASSVWSWQTWQHTLAMADLLIDLEGEFGPHNVLSERQLRGLIAEASFATKEREHLPDAGIVVEGAPTLAIELERTPKAQARLRAIIADYAYSQRWPRVRYYARAQSLPRIRSAAEAAGATAWLELAAWEGPRWAIQ
jgi:hypothetical protein